MSLSVMSILLLQILNQVMPPFIFTYVAFILVGCFSFSAFGILLGFLCRNQASARTLGVIFYLPLLVPVALADFSKNLGGVLKFLPSFQFYESLQTILFENSESISLLFSAIYLFLLGSCLIGVSYLLMKKRWLM